ncbi:futalosine hydrolase [Streptomyces sp. NPDC046939]|uniref:futalosine hydrolase n=1 Tax=Streptomyces sp. NPDC046939 TaxID=3155376 RepID=UPI0033F8D190
MVVQAREEEGLLTDTGPAHPHGRVLIATAVPAERDAVARGLRTHHPAKNTTDTGDATDAADVIDVIAVGVGPAAAAAGTATALTTAALTGRPYTLVVSAGIGGGFGAPPGAILIADAITVADLGAETPEGFLPVTELGFGTVTHSPPPSLVRDLAEVTAATATGTVLTVSTVTGTADRAALLARRHPDAVAEAMEGFGVAEAAAAHGVPVAEIRTVSNAVGPRDRAAWRIGDAFAALTEAFGKAAPVLRGWKNT